MTQPKSAPKEPTVLDHYPTMVEPERFKDLAPPQPDKTAIFPPLRSESELVGYLRTGGCTAGCGACCEAFVVPIDVDGLKSENFEGLTSGGLLVLPIDSRVRGNTEFADWEYWLKLHDVWLYENTGGDLTAVVTGIKVDSLPPLELDAWSEWLAKYDVTLLRRDGQQVLAYIKIRCEKLTEDGMCGVFGTDERPQMCAPYPEHPLDVEGIDFCTYNFRPIKKSDLRTVGSVADKPKKKRKKR